MTETEAIAYRMSIVSISFLYGNANTPRWNDFGQTLTVREASGHFDIDQGYIRDMILRGILRIKKGSAPKQIYLTSLCQWWETSRAVVARKKSLT